MSHTTLEEVFLNLAHAGASAAAAIGAGPARAPGADTPAGGVSATAVEMVPIGGARQVSPGFASVAPPAAAATTAAAAAAAAPTDVDVELRAVNLRDLDERAPKSRATRESRQFRAMFRKTFANQVRTAPTHNTHTHTHTPHATHENTTRVHPADVCTCCCRAVQSRQKKSNACQVIFPILTLLILWALQVRVRVPWV